MWPSLAALRLTTPPHARFARRYKGFFGGVGTNKPTEMPFYKQDEGESSDPSEAPDWGFSVKNRNGATPMNLPVVDLALFVNDHVGKALVKPKTLMKLDVEGSEYHVLPHMLTLDSFKHVDVLTAEFHTRHCPMKFGDVTYSKEECEAFDLLFPKFIGMYDTTLSFVDDEKWGQDGQPLPK